MNAGLLLQRTVIHGGVVAAFVAVGLLVVLWLAWLVARAAERKGRNFWPWLWIAFFFLIPAAIIVAIMGPKPEPAVVVSSGPPPAPEPKTEPVKRCPYCGEEILAVAKKCKHCGEFLTTE